MHKLSECDFSQKRKTNNFFYWKRSEHSIHFSILVMDIFIHKLPPLLVWAMLKPLQQWLCLSHHLRTFLIQYWRRQLIQEGSHLLISPGNEMAGRKLVAIPLAHLFSFAGHHGTKSFVEVEGRLKVFHNLFIKKKEGKFVKK